MWRISLALCLSLPACKPAASSSPSAATSPVSVDSPQTRSEEIVDRFHGVDVADPYRWLEAGEADEVKAWSDT